MNSYEMAQLSDELEKVAEIMTGLRTKFINSGWSDAGAEEMVIRLAECMSYGEEGD